MDGNTLYALLVGLLWGITGTALVMNAVETTKANTSTIEALDAVLAGRTKA